MSKKPLIVDIEVVFAYRTQRAICVKKDESDKEGIWLPKSMIEVEAPRGFIRGAVITVTGPQSLFEEKGLV